jgi:hypothetical protein
VNDKITQEEVEKMVNGNRVIAGYTWFKVVVGSIEEQTKHSKYYETSSEQMADNFAARFGHGRALITALNKMHVTASSPETSSSQYYISRIKEAFLTALLPLGAAGALASGTVFLIPLGVLFAVASLVVFRASGEDALDYTYDGLRDRYKRVRNQYVENLKRINTGKLSGKEIERIEQILHDIELMDKFMNSAMNYKPILNSIANFIFSDSRNAKNAVNEQKMLEDLAASDLFIKSAELRVLA